MKTIDFLAFYRCTSVKSIVCLGEEPPKTRGVDYYQGSKTEFAYDYVDFFKWAEGSGMTGELLLTPRGIRYEEFRKQFPITLYVPEKSIEKYRACKLGPEFSYDNAMWGDFKDIRSLEEYYKSIETDNPGLADDTDNISAGIGSVDGTPATADGCIYDITGRLVSADASDEAFEALAPGIYIRNGRKVVRY